jgi:phage recombination protein Bet
MATAQDRGLIKYESRGQEVILSAAIVRDFLVTGKKELVTDQEIFYFLGICKARQLNPFVKDCYLIKYGSEPAAIVTAIDFYRSRARAAVDCTGWEKGVICLNKETGELRYSKGLVLPTEELVGGWFRARPKGWNVDFELEVNLSGYIKTTADGRITKFWSEANQPSQIMKVAESQGLRTIWPDLFQGTYTADERNFNLDDLDAGGPPPAGGPGDITPKPEPEGPKLDTSKFDRAVKKLKWDKETLDQLEKWLTATATIVSKNQDKIITADMIKLSCVSTNPPVDKSYATRWDEFLGKFKIWQDANYPPAGAAQEPAIQPPAVEESGATTAALPGKEPSGDPEVRTIEERREAVWDQVIKKVIPLASLAVLDPPVSAPGHITEANIGEAEELVATYQAPTGGKKK